MKLVLSGGGTGGHVYPALAVAQEWLRQSPENQILYIGTEKGLENAIVKKAGLPFETIEVQGFKRSLSLYNLQTIQRFVQGVRDAKRLLRSFRPDVVLGTGGYVAGPVLYAAHRLKIPIAIHEQNVVPGLTNRFLSRYADLIALSFAETERHFRKSANLLLTGNPRASEVVQADPRKGWASLSLPPGTRLVLVVGGSRGAKAINETFLAMIPQLAALPDVHFVYVTGEVHYETIRRQAEQQLSLNPSVRKKLTILPFLDNMPEVLAAAILVVSRAGATMLSEITALGLPSILIPSPYVTNNHQEKNARWLTDAGASVMIREKDLSAQLLFEELAGLLHHPERLQAMGRSAKKLGHPDACQKLCRALIEIARR